ncbi:MAG: universal stress protein, partial [Actinobacteria bacterium]|nr:universal stress protein [Actinomycetota bacterium]
APFLLGRLDESAWVREWEQQTQEDLRHEIMRIRLAGVDAVAECSLDDPTDLLRELAEELDADYIVIPDDSEGLVADLLVGSMARRLKRMSRVPVVVVRDDK